MSLRSLGTLACRIQKLLITLSIILWERMRQPELSFRRESGPELTSSSLLLVVSFPASSYPHPPRLGQETSSPTHHPTLALILGFGCDSQNQEGRKSNFTELCWQTWEQTLRQNGNRRGSTHPSPSLRTRKGGKRKERNRVSYALPLLCWPGRDVRQTRSFNPSPSRKPHQSAGQQMSQQRKVSEDLLELLAVSANKVILGWRGLSSSVLP